MTTRLELKGITKAYPGTLANDAIDLAIDAGVTVGMRIAAHPPRRSGRGR